MESDSTGARVRAFIDRHKLALCIAWDAAPSVTVAMTVVVCWDWIRNLEK